MSLYHLSDRYLAQYIKENNYQEDNVSLRHLNVNIGNTFLIRISYDDKSSVLLTKEIDFYKYSQLFIELFYYKNLPPAEDLYMTPMEFDLPQTDQTIPPDRIRFEFSVEIFQHINIDPNIDHLFKDQKWIKFARYGHYVGAYQDWIEICNIIRFCDKLAANKLFW